MVAGRRVTTFQQLGLSPAMYQHVLAQLTKRTGIDASPVYTVQTKNGIGGLYQGMAPPSGPLLRQTGFDMIVLCAEEWQPPGFAEDTCAAVLGYQKGVDPYPGVALVHAPADDDFSKPPSREVLALAVKAASYAAYRVAQGGNVLVSCWAGINRSGLVTALALHKLTGLSGKDCVSMIQRARPQALKNPQFVAVLSKILPAQKAPNGVLVGT